METHELRLHKRAKTTSYEMDELISRIGQNVLTWTVLFLILLVLLVYTFTET